jgi:YVTN family beta-propeller protein
MSAKRVSLLFKTALAALVFAAFFASARVRAQSHNPALLVLEKADHQLAVADPIKLTVIARVPAGPDPHEVTLSSDGKLAYISNYGGPDSDLHTISVVDLAAGKALAPIDISPVHSAHGLDFVGGKLYFTAETNKVIARYDPATRRIDWILGTGQDRTHMVWVAPSQDRIFTSNVNSGTISIIECVRPPSPGFVPPGGMRKTWEVTNVPSGRGSEGFDVSPDGKEIWAANAQDGTVTVIDVAQRRAKKTFPIAVRGANRLKFTLDGKYVLISGLGGPRLQGQSSAPNLVVIDAATRKEVKRLSLGGGSAGILMQPDGSRAYVAVSAANKVAVIDLKTFQVAGEIRMGRGPDGMAWVPNAVSRD